MTFDPRREPALSWIQGLLTRELARVRSCESAIRRDGSVDAIHDSRVAQRRTRVILREYGDLLPPEARLLRRELRWLSRRTGPVRDLDILIERVHGDLRAVLGRARDASLARLVARLESDRYADLRDRWETLADGADAGPAESDRFAALTRPRLGRRFDRLVEAIGTVTAAPSNEGIHRVRIAAKSVRYLLEFLHEARPSADAAAVLVSLKRLQDRLGAFQDMVVHAGLLAGMTDSRTALRRAAVLRRRLRRSRPAVVRALGRFAGPRTLARMDRLVLGRRRVRTPN